MNEPKITINVMPGAQMNGYVKEQHNYFGSVQQITSEEKTKNAEDAGVIDEVRNVDKQTPISEIKLPRVLASDEAMKYWTKLRNEKFVDTDYQLLPETTRKQAMYIAEAFAEKLGIQSKWKTFEQLWCISNLAQEKWDFQQTGTSPTRSKEIDKIFED